MARPPGAESARVERCRADRLNARRVFTIGAEKRSGGTAGQVIQRQVLATAPVLVAFRARHKGKAAGNRRCRNVGFGLAAVGGGQQQQPLLAQSSQASVPPGGVVVVLQYAPRADYGLCAAGSHHRAFRGRAGAEVVPRQRLPVDRESVQAQRTGAPTSATHDPQDLAPPDVCDQAPVRRPGGRSAGRQPAGATIAEPYHPQPAASRDREHGAVRRPAGRCSGAEPSRVLHACGCTHPHHPVPNDRQLTR